MKNISRKIIAYILVISMMLTMNTSVFAAIDTDVKTEPVTETGTVYHINPIYSEEISSSDLDTASEYAASTMSEPEYISDETEIVETIRAAMTERVDKFTVYYTRDTDLDEATIDAWIIQAVSETGDPKQGDYLKFQYGGCEISYLTTVYSTGKREFDITFYFTYYTTAEQEAVVDKKVKELLAGLDDSYSDYEKTKLIYDYICNNVTYDYANLENDSYELKYTAYAALIDKTAVCQGYACLLYRLLREAGVDARIIFGTSNGENHSWNIVKIGGRYYLADATWDRACIEAEVDYRYFLKGTDNFTDHMSDAEYTDASFTAKYPVSATDYDPAASNYSGTCGDDLTWHLDGEGVLTISGSGAMYDYTPENTNIYIENTEAPWGKYDDKIKKLVIKPGVTTISGYAFYNCNNLSGRVEIPESVESVGKRAFFSCENLERIAFLNSECVIEPQVNAVVKSVAIEGYAGSTAQAYAESERLDFIMIHEHEWDEGYIWPKPDCEDGGNVLYKCSIEGCAEEKEEALQALGHSYGDWYLKKVATATEEGSYERKCENCSSGYEEETAGFDPEVKAGGFCGRDLTWRLDFAGTLTISGTGEMKAYTSSEENYKYLTDAPWGTYADELKTLILEDGITLIGSNAFIGCANLSGELVIPDTVTFIESYAFSGCKGFTGDLVIPDSVTEVQWNAFHGCSGFDGKLKLSENMTSISYDTFSDCSSLTGNIVIPESVTKIGSDAFYNCRNMDGKLLLHDGIIKIGESAFSKCESLTGELDLPSGLTAIECYTFNHCNGLTGNLIIPEGVTSIGESAFEMCEGFSGELVLPEGVTSIGKKAFRFCTGLTGLDFPKTLEQINKGAFEYDRIKGTVVIPESVTLIGENAFTTNYYLNNKIEKIIILNPECVIEDGGAAIMEPTVVVGHAGSTAQVYAKAEGLVFRCIEHNWETIDKEPTCTEEGYTENVCTACGDSHVDEDSMIPALGHTPGTDATCTTNQICTVCEEELMPAQGHSFNEWNTITEATCVTKGEEESMCADCGATKIEVVAKKAHSYTAATCTKAKTCKVCGATSGSALGHKYSTKYTVDKKATTSTAGSKSKHCTVCDIKNKDTVTTIPKISTATLSTVKYTYSGSAKTPSVTVKDANGKTLVKGTDYSVSYPTARTKTGVYKVTVTFKGSYSGAKTMNFSIVPKAPSSASAALSTASDGYDDIKFSWKASTGASGYLVYYKKGSGSWSKAVATKSTSYTKKELAGGAKYTFKVVPYYLYGTTKYYNSAQYKTASTYTLKKLGTPKVTKSGSKVKVSWTNISGETGYQISQSTSKSKTKIVATYKTTSGKSKVISAAKGKTYYYKVRAYKTVGTKKVYGPWSTVKSYKRK